MSQLVEWLTELDLARYVDQFREGEIEFGDLKYLTETDLVEIGLPVGPRRRVMAAIDRMRSVEELDSDQTLQSDGGAGEHMDLVLQGPSGNGRHADAEEIDIVSTGPERRHLTIMFVDLVGSTEMAVGVDPEDTRAVISRYQNGVSSVISEFQGFVARYMGDGVLCYFGWPIASEDDALRSVRAGLRIIETISQFKDPGGSPLSTRIGIAAGVVVVGDLIGTGVSEEAAVVGETANLAARLQGLAKPNQLVVPGTMRRLLGNSFVLESTGEHQLKGIGTPVHAFSVTGERVLESRFASRRTRLAPIVGRDQELKLLLQYWGQAVRGTGGAVLLTGEAGMGKSRLAHALIDNDCVEPIARIIWQCSPYHTDSAFYPVLSQLRVAADFTQGDSPEILQSKLETLPGIDAGNKNLLALLLGIHNDEQNSILDLAPAALREETLLAVCHMIEQRAFKQPLLLIFEDLHWADPTSLELLQLLQTRLKKHSLLIVATARLTFKPDPLLVQGLESIALQRLSIDQVDRIAHQFTNGKPLPEQALKLIAKKTDGVPLFVEELTRSILESDFLIDTGDRFNLSGDQDLNTIPDTLQDILMARLDRLAWVKPIAQTAACIGREFNLDLLVCVLAQERLEVEEAVSALAGAELVFKVEDSSVYQFKHALVRDAAYASLLKASRRNIHKRILQEIENSIEQNSDELCAWHAEAAGLTERAIELWGAASASAIKRPAYDEAIAHLTRAIALLAPLIDDGRNLHDRSALINQALSLQIQLGAALATRKGYSADETHRAFVRALELIELLGESPLRYTVLHGLWGVQYLRAEHETGLHQAHSILEHAEQENQPGALQVANRTVGMTLALQGRFLEAQPYFDRAYGLLDSLEREERTALTNRFQDPGVGVNCYLALNLWLLGQTRRADRHAEEATRTALETGHTNTKCYMHNHLMLYSYFCKDIESSRHHTNAMADIAADHNMVLWLNLANVSQTLLHLADGSSVNLDHYYEADATYTAANTRVFISYYRVEAAARAIAIGLYKDARRLLNMAKDVMEQTGERFAQSYLYQVEAVLAESRGDVEVSFEHLQESVLISSRFGGNSWQLSATLELVRLASGGDQSTAAINALKKIYRQIEIGDCRENMQKAGKLLKVQESPTL